LTFCLSPPARPPENFRVPGTLNYRARLPETHPLPARLLWLKPETRSNLKCPTRHSTRTVIRTRHLYTVFISSHKECLFSYSMRLGAKIFCYINKSSSIRLVKKRTLKFNNVSEFIICQHYFVILLYIIESEHNTHYIFALVKIYIIDIHPTVVKLFEKIKVY